MTRFLASLAQAGRLSASSQTQALSALLFLYKDVLHRELEAIGPIPHAKQPVRVPVVLDRDEVRLLLGAATTSTSQWCNAPSSSRQPTPA